LVELDAAALAATARVDLSLHHRGATEALGDAPGLVGTARHLPFRHGDAVAPEQVLGLVFVDVHPCLRGNDWTDGASSVVGKVAEVALG